MMYLSYCVFFKQKTAYEMRISDWSSDVCSSDLEIESAGLRLELRLGAHPAQDFLRIGQQREHRRGRRGYVRFAANDEGFLHRSPPELGSPRSRIGRWMRLRHHHHPGADDKPAAPAA